MKVKFISYLVLIPLVVVIFVFLNDDGTEENSWEEATEESDYGNDEAPEYPIEEEPYYYEEEPYDAAPMDDDISDFAEVEPQFPGGEAAMADFIAENIIYPEYERELGLQGTVYAQFVVDKNGTIRDVKIVKDIAGASNFGPEVIRVIKSMPAWTPGEQDGEKVSVRYTLPVNFKIQ